jgi:hypothetical protein
VVATWQTHKVGHQSTRTRQYCQTVNLDASDVGVLS